MCKCNKCKKTKETVRAYGRNLCINCLLSVLAMIVMIEDVDIENQMKFIMKD